MRIQRCRRRRHVDDRRGAVHNRTACRKRPAVDLVTAARHKIAGQCDLRLRGRRNGAVEAVDKRTVIRVERDGLRRRHPQSREDHAAFGNRDTAQRFVIGVHGAVGCTPAVEQPIGRVVRLGQPGTVVACTVSRACRERRHVVAGDEVGNGVLGKPAMIARLELHGHDAHPHRTRSDVTQRDGLPAGSLEFGGTQERDDLAVFFDLDGFAVVIGHAECPAREAPAGIVGHVDALHAVIGGGSHAVLVGDKARVVRLRDGTRRARLLNQRTAVGQ